MNFLLGEGKLSPSLNNFKSSTNFPTEGGNENA
jgi:hypothetical protein